MQAKHKNSGEVHEIWAIDDYFGKHEYGYIFKSGEALTEEQFAEQYERTKP